MAFRPKWRFLLIVAFVGCYSPPDPPPTVRVGALEETSLVLQAVDAGTGSALADDEMTVRYLVRAPIAFDVSSVQEVSSLDPYEISHPVGEDELVLEVRLEADSYHRLDTVLAVAKGTSAGPLTVRLSRRLGLSTPTESVTRPTTPDPDPVPSGPDFTSVRAGDRFFAQGAWLEATEAYQRMPAPADELSDYGRAYLQGRLNQGIAHIERSEYARALEVFESAAAMRDPGPDAFLRLGQAQCAVGRTEEGRGTLASVERMRSRLPPLEQNRVSALVAYRRGVCSQGEFERAETTRSRVQAGSRALQELNAFAEGARAMSPIPAEVMTAIADAERRVEAIQRSIVPGR